MQGAAPTPDELLRQRAASPTGSLNRGLKSSTGSLNGGGIPQQAASSIGQLMTNGGSAPLSQSQPQQQQSPTQNGLNSSFGFGGSKIAKRSTTTGGSSPPVRPARPGDEDFGSSSGESQSQNRKTMDHPQSVPGLGMGLPSNGAGERAMSPTGAGGLRIGGIGGGAASGIRKTSGGGNVGGGPVRDRAASPTMGYQQPQTQPLAQTQQQVAQTPPTSNMNAFQQPTSQTFSDEPNLSGLAPAVGSLPSTSSPPVQAPSDAFYYGSRNAGPQPQQPVSPQQPSYSSPQQPNGHDLHSTAPTPIDSSALRLKDQEIERLKSEQKWMVVALQNAKRKGYQFEGEQGGEEKLRAVGGSQDEDEEKGELIEMLLALKSELSKTKVSSVSIALLTRLILTSHSETTGATR